MSNKDKRVTMYTIAAEVGMSIAAVSRAFDPNSRLKPEKRQLILDTAKRLGYVQNKMAARLSGEPMKIGVLIYGSLKEYYSEYVAGIQDAHNTFADYKVDCDLHVLDIWTNPPEEVQWVIDRFIEQRVDAAVISGMSEQFNRHLNRLAEAGIRFILLDSDIPGCCRSCVSGNDTETAGQMAAQLLQCAMAANPAVHSRQVAIFRATADNLSQKSLVGSFCRAARRYGLEVVQIRDTENVPERAAWLTAQLFEEYPEIGGIYVSTANSAAVCRRLHELGKAGLIGVVTSDVFEELNGYLRDGTVFATIYQDPFYQARVAFETLFYAISEEEPIPEKLMAKPQAVFESNLHLFDH